MSDKFLIVRYNPISSITSLHQADFFLSKLADSPSLGICKNVLLHHVFEPLQNEKMAKIRLLLWAIRQLGILLGSGCRQHLLQCPQPWPDVV